jgi:hypothetical protein
MLHWLEIRFRLLRLANPKTGRKYRKAYIKYITGNIVTDFLLKNTPFFI